MLRKTLTYANVTATLALFVALGGVGYAAVKLPSNSVGAAQIKKNAVSGAKVASNSLTGADIKESTLAKVPSAASADHAAPAGAAGGDLTGSYPAPGLADGSVTGGKVRDGSLTGADIGAGSLTGADIGAGQVGLANVANDLHQTCPADTHYYMGACFDVTARAPLAWSSAEAKCETLGGHLPSPEDLYGLRTQPWTAVDASTGEWTGHFWTDGGSTYVELIAATGFNKRAIVGGSIGYRCALPPLG